MTHDINALENWHKVGQLIMGQIFGTELSPEFKQYIEKYPLGGYRLCQYNIKTPSQVRRLISQINDVFDDMKLPRPIISTDEEGGTLCVFRGIIDDFPGTMALGATQSGRLAYMQAKHIAWKMNDMGLSMNFVPVCDTNLEPKNTVVGIRAFSDKAGLCSRMALCVAKGTNAGGLLNCAKHFPGHGGTLGDTHYGMAIDGRSADILMKEEVNSFTGCINAKVDAVFASHVLYPAVDDKYPASLSKVWLTDILRNELKFKGVIMTDDIMMDVIVNTWGADKAALMHILAGGDMAMVCGDMETVSDTYELLYKSLSDGVISQQRLDHSAARILEMKDNFSRYSKEKCQILPKGKELSREICEKASTLISKGLALPMEENRKILVIKPVTQNLTVSDTSQQISINLEKYVSRYSALVDTVSLHLDAEMDEIYTLLDKVKDYDYVIQMTTGALTYQNQAKLFNRLPPEKAAAVLIREPYDALLLDEAKTVICVYSGIDNATENAADILFGKKSCSGKSPVKLKI